MQSLLVLHAVGLHDYAESALCWAGALRDGALNSSCYVSRHGALDTYNNCFIVKAILVDYFISTELERLSWQA